MAVAMAGERRAKNISDYLSRRCIAMSSKAQSASNHRFRKFDLHITHVHNAMLAKNG